MKHTLLAPMEQELPKLSNDANIRIEWYKELEDGKTETYIVDALVSCGLEPNDPFFEDSIDIDIISLFRENAKVYSEFDLNLLTEEDQDAIEEALKFEVCQNPELYIDGYDNDELEDGEGELEF